jgi:salicylate hydroxylase
MTLQGCEIIVVGGGVAGLAAATAFGQRGAQVLLLEQAGGFLEVGAGVQVSPNGARVLTSLGLKQWLTPLAMRSRAVRLHNAQGRKVLDMALPANGPGFYMFHRADLVDLLRNNLRNVQTRLVARVISADPTGPRASVTLDSGEVLTADLVIGADGLHSVLRSVVEGAQETPFFTGQVAWRALIPGDSDDAVAQVFMGPGRHLVSYPLRGGRLRNIVAVEDRKHWANEGWNHPDSPENLRTAFADFRGPVPDWLAKVEKVYLWGLFRHNVARHWWRGRAAIIGDAAHPTLPFMAQGANLALEDALTLARALERGPPETVLTDWAQARRARTARVIEAANRNARNYHLRPPLAPLAHTALRLSGRLMPDAGMRQFRWIYDFDADKA